MVSASLPHALWDTVVSMDTVPLEAAIALLSYAVLAAAVLKAREISPNRSILQPSVIFGGPRPAPAYAAPAAELLRQWLRRRVCFAGAVLPTHGRQRMQAARCTRSPRPAGSNGNRLRVGAKFLVIVPGLRLLEHQVPGLMAQSPGGPVAEVTRNPSDPIGSGADEPFQLRMGSGLERRPAPDRARAND